MIWKSCPWLVASSNHPHYIPRPRGAQNIMCTNTNFNLAEYELWGLCVERVRSTSMLGANSSHSLNPCAFCVKIRVPELYNEPTCWIYKNQHILSKISRNCSNSFVKCDQNVLGAKLDTHSVRKLGRMRFWSGFDDCNILCALFFKSEGKCTLVASSNHPHYIPSGWDVQNIMEIITNANLLEYRLWRLRVECVRSTSMWSCNSSHSLNPCAFCVKIRVPEMYNEPACWIRENLHIFVQFQRIDQIP